MINVTISFGHLSRPTIYSVLKEKLGREPTNIELHDDVKRILDDGMVERAGKGKLPWQRRK